MKDKKNAKMSQSFLEGFSDPENTSSKPRHLTRMDKKLNEYDKKKHTQNKGK